MKMEPYDTSEKAWSFYTLIYQDMIFDEGFQFENNKIQVSGDICFNFNYKKVKYFKEIVKRDKKVNEEVKKQINELIDMCNSYHHTPVNISILPKTGGLNNTKQAIGNDRFDAFIWAMSIYFQEYKTLIKDNGSTPNIAYGNRALMACFLDSFSNGIYQFCKVIYQIDDIRFVNELIKSGSKSVDSCKKVFEYIQLAISFWEKRANFFFCNQNIKEEYTSMNGKTEEEINNYFKEKIRLIGENLIAMDNMFIEGRPATFATAGENQWKNLVDKILVNQINISQCLKLNFYIDKSEFYIDGFDIDNLCEPVFQVLTSKLGWFEGKRANIKGFVASKFLSAEKKGLELEQIDCIEENKEQALFDNIYTGPFPNKATDPQIIDWLEQFKFEDDSESYHLRLCFGSKKLSIATISSGKIKPIIDGLYKLIGGKKGEPDDHKIYRLSVQKAVDYLNDNQVRILLYKL